jgi:hypothetical protein
MLKIHNEDRYKKLFQCSQLQRGTVLLSGLSGHLPGWRVLGQRDTRLSLHILQVSTCKPNLSFSVGSVSFLGLRDPDP